MTEERWRVVQLVRWEGGERVSYGSGYLVRTNVVLTSGHLVDEGAAQDLRVEFPAAESAVQPVQVIDSWSDESGTCDLALLYTQQVKSSEPARPARFARLGQVLPEVAGRAMGYPRFKFRESQHALDGRAQRTLADVSGRIKLRTLGGVGGLEFVLDDPAPRDDPEGPWKAMSGAPVWVGGKIVAVVVAHHAAEGTGRLVLQPVEALYHVTPRADRERALSALHLPVGYGDLPEIVPDPFGVQAVPQHTPIARFILVPERHARVPLFDGHQVTVGRDPANDVVLNRPGISGSHCRFTVRWDPSEARRTALLMDLHSENGTTVAGDEVEPWIWHVVREGDEVVLGGHVALALRSYRRPR